MLTCLWSLKAKKRYRLVVLLPPPPSGATIYARQFSDNLNQGNPCWELLSSVFLDTKFHYSFIALPLTLTCLISLEPLLQQDHAAVTDVWHSLIATRSLIAVFTCARFHLWISQTCTTTIRYCPILATYRYSISSLEIHTTILILCYTLRQCLVLSARNNMRRNPVQEQFITVGCVAC